MLLRLIRAQLAGRGRWLALLVALQLVATVASLLLPSLNAAIIDRGLARGDTGYIWRTGLVMLAVSAVQAVAGGSAAYCGARIAMGFGQDTRAAVFDRVLRLSPQQVRHLGPPTLITRCTNDVQQVQTLVLMSCTLVVMAPMMMIGGVVMALREDVGLSWLMAVSVPVLAAFVGFLVARMIPGWRLVQVRLDTLNRVLREQLMGLRVVRAFVREPEETERFERANLEFTDISRRVTRLMIAMFPVVMLVMNLSTVAVIWFGGHRVDDGEMQIGAVTAYMTYLIQILMSVMLATFMVMMIPRASVSAERIGEVLETAPSVVPPDEPASLTRLTGVLELDDVSLTYPGAEAPVLCGVRLRAVPGQTVAVVGSTGSGKSTLLSLIARLVDPTQGRVLLDGIDVRDIDPEVLWGHLGIVPQQPYLFSGTVAENLRLGNPDASDDELWHALQIACADDFVRRMDGGLTAEVAQGGTSVSGGQRQRLCIARAVVARPRLYLFDDSFSALDVATDSRVRAGLRDVTSDATVVVVAQRVSSIRDADRILVLDDGRVVGDGTHDELVAGCPTYAEIVASQSAVGVA